MTEGVRQKRTSAPEGLLTSPERVAWSVGTGPAIREAVRVDVGRKTILAPTGSDDHARALRLLATVRAALEPEDLEGHAAEIDAHYLAHVTDLGPAFATAIEGWRIARHAREHNLADVDAIRDPALVDRARRYAEAGLDHAALLAYVEAQGTGESRSVSRAITEKAPHLRPYLSAIRDRIGATLSKVESRRYPGLHHHARTYVTALPGGSDDQPPMLSPGAWLSGRQAASVLASILEAVPPRRERRREGGKGENGEPIPPHDGGPFWRSSRVWRGPLARAHLGMMARTKRDRSATGRIIRDPARLYTDPDRRAFSRRTRGHGATVVVDCSGSMSLTLDDVTNVLGQAGGATVWAYRFDAHHSESVYLLAHGGRMVAELPFRPGGSNGCDAPALRIAARYHDPRTPFVWITDGDYNGAGRSAPDRYLALDLLDVGLAARVITMPTIERAVAMFARIASGGHPDAPGLPESVTRYSSPLDLEGPRRPAWLSSPEVGTAKL